MGSIIKVSEPINTRAILFGGFDMKPCHLSRLSKLYQKNNLSEVEILCQPLHMLSIPFFGARRALEIAEWMNGLDHNDGNVIHVFSGATYLFARVLSHLTERARASIKGVVFECSPMDCGPEQFGRFVSWRLGRQYSSKYALPFIPFCSFAGLNERFKARYRMERMLLSVDTKVCFVLSSEDQIIDPSFVNEYKLELEKNGNITSMTEFKGAGHCRALLDCADDYRFNLSRFVIGVFSNSHVESFDESEAA